VNSAFEKLTGFTLEEVTGKDFTDIHRLDPNVNLIKEQISKGSVYIEFYSIRPSHVRQFLFMRRFPLFDKIWDGQLKYPNENGDSVAQLTKFIPVLINEG
jgi:hypothetical protein